MGWSVIKTHPHCSVLAAKHLQLQGFTHYNPIVNEPAKKGWRKTQLFSNYIFVELKSSWPLMMSVIGISKVLISDGLPIAVHDSVIEDLKAMEDADGIVQLNRSRFRHGDPVNIESGSFSFMAGLHEGQCSEDRVSVMLTLLGTQRDSQNDLSVLT